MSCYNLENLYLKINDKRIKGLSDIDNLTNYFITNFIKNDFELYSKSMINYDSDLVVTSEQEYVDINFNVRIIKNK